MLVQRNLETNMSQPVCAQWDETRIDGHWRLVRVNIEIYCYLCFLIAWRQTEYFPLFYSQGCLVKYHPIKVPFEGMAYREHHVNLGSQASEKMLWEAQGSLCNYGCRCGVVEVLQASVNLCYLCASYILVSSTSFVVWKSLQNVIWQNVIKAFTLVFPKVL